MARFGFGVNFHICWQLAFDKYHVWQTSSLEDESNSCLLLFFLGALFEGEPLIKHLHTTCFLLLNSMGMPCHAMPALYGPLDIVSVGGTQ